MSQTEETIEVKIQPTVYVQVMMPTGVIQVFERPIYAEVAAVGPQGAAGVPGVPGAPGAPGQSAILGTWHGVWTNTVQYPPLGLVQHQGSTYLNTSEFLTSPFPTAEVPPAAPWELVAAKGEQADPFKYVHIQSTPDSVWTVSHGLGGFPSVTAVDSTDREIVGDVQYLSSNHLSITFSSGNSGKVYVS